MNERLLRVGDSLGELARRIIKCFFLLVAAIFVVKGLVDIDQQIREQRIVEQQRVLKQQYVALRELYKENREANKYFVGLIEKDKAEAKKARENFVFFKPPKNWCPPD